MLCSLLVHLFSIFEGLVAVHFGCQGPCPSHEAVYWLHYQTHQHWCCRRVQLKFISWSLLFLVCFADLLCLSSFNSQRQNTFQELFSDISKLWELSSCNSLSVEPLQLETNCVPHPRWKCVQQGYFAWLLFFMQSRNLVVGTLASCWNKENLDVKRRKWRKVKDWREFSGQPLREF